jgi:hypothetical protein
MTDVASGGRIVESEGEEPGSGFAFNCDTATPMRRRDRAVYAVDLFADALVQADAVSYRVCDLEELELARRDGLILPGEARGAMRGLAELTGIIDRGDLLAFLSRTCPISPLDPPAASPVGRAALEQVPLLGPDSRAAWVRQEGLRR